MKSACLERQSDSEMERKVATELGINDRVVPLSRRVGRVYGFHAGIETQHEVVEVEAQS